MNARECWTLWSQRQKLSDNNSGTERAQLAIETHLERITLHRPLENIADTGQREQARQVRDWFGSVFLQSIA